ncbi:MAG: sodium-dependent transporter, partial [Anaerotignum sp.]|nr:sodium-dependent transporter [Anaerotignum sp.]
AGNYLLMMFYTTVAGWMLYYFFKMAAGGFSGMTPDEVGAAFNNTLGSPSINIGFMVLVVIIGMVVVGMGLQNGVEKITKVMMLALLVLMVVLAVRSIFLPGGEEGLKFYLTPNLDAIREHGLSTVLFAAMSQAFFTLSIGMGSMAIFGSYIDRSRALCGEAISITVLDTSVALMAGLIIFPACFAYGVDPGAGPGLIFVTLPNVFNAMPGGRLWGTLFFLFMCFAAFSTVIAVFQNLIAFWEDLTDMPKKKIVAIHIVLLLILCLPCALGYNVLADFQPLGAGSGVLDLEDFIVSNNILPLGSLIYVIFCSWKMGWGWDKFIGEANTGNGIKFPNAIRLYIKYILPLIILYVFVMGWKSIIG